MNRVAGEDFFTADTEAKKGSLNDSGGIRVTGVRFRREQDVRSSRVARWDTKEAESRAPVLTTLCLDLS